MEGTYMVSEYTTREHLVSNSYGDGISVSRKVVNDSDSFIIPKKGKFVG